MVKSENNEQHRFIFLTILTSPSSKRQRTNEFELLRQVYKTLSLVLTGWLEYSCALADMR